MFLSLVEEKVEVKDSKKMKTRNKQTNPGLYTYVNISVILYVANKFTSQCSYED